MEHVKDRRIIGTGEKAQHVIHEGLNNYPTLKAELKRCIDRLQERHDNNERHLSDIACVIGFITKDLDTLSKKIFAMHEHEKKYGV